MTRIYQKKMRPSFLLVPSPQSQAAILQNFSHKRPNLPGDSSIPRPKSNHSVLRQIHFSHRVKSESSDWMNGTSLLAILRLMFRCLECFSMVNIWTPYWNIFSSELKDVLSNIVHLSTLKTLRLIGVKVPITFFLHIVHLTTLELYPVSPNDFFEESSSSLTLASSTKKRVAPMASQTEIDRCLWHILCLTGTGFPSSAYFSLIQDIESLTESIFLPFMCRLRFFKIYFAFGSANMHDFNILSSLMGSLCISLTSLATLEHLQSLISFRGFVRDFDSDEFFDNLRHAEPGVIWTPLSLIQPVHITTG